MSPRSHARDDHRFAGRSALRIMLGSVLAMAVALTSAAEGLAQDVAPGPGSDSEDLWFHLGSTLTHVDGRSGVVVERRDVSVPECQVPSDLPVFARTGHHDILLRRGAYEFAEFDPDYVVVGSCILRIPLDGSEVESHPIPRPRRAMVVNDIAVVDDAIWVVAWDRRSRRDTLDYDTDLALYRLDEWTGDLDLVRERVLSVAPSAAGPVVLFTEEGKPSEPRVGVIDPSLPEPRQFQALQDALPTVRRSAIPEPRLRLATGADGLLALYDRWASSDIVVFDPGSDSLVGEVATAGQVGSLGEVYPTSRGVWMGGQRLDGGDFVRFAGQDGTVVDIDPCDGVLGACFGGLEAASGDAVWVSAWPYDEESFELDPGNARLRRYEAGASEPTLELKGADLFLP